MDFRPLRLFRNTAYCALTLILCWQTAQAAEQKLVQLSTKDVIGILNSKPPCQAADDVPTTLEVATWSADLGDTEGGWFEVSEAYCTVVTWTGRVRPIAPTTKTFLHEWKVAVRANVDVDEIFRHEVEVTDGDNASWILIQGRLLDALRGYAAKQTFTIQFKRFGVHGGSVAVLAIQGFSQGGRNFSALQVFRPEIPGSKIEQVQMLLRYLIRKHPDKTFAEEMNDWIVSGKVAYSINAPVAEMAVTVEAKNLDLPVLMINANWFTNGKNKYFELDNLYKSFVLYHEYVHLKHHFSGEMVLFPLLIDADEFANNLPTYAQRLWEAEYAAYKAELALAVELDRTYALGNSWQDRAVHYSEREYVRALHKLLTQSTGNFVQASDAEKTRPHFDQIYHQYIRSLK